MAGGDSTSDSELPSKAFDDLARPAGLVSGAAVSPHKHHHEQLGLGWALEEAAEGGGRGTTPASTGTPNNLIGTTMAHVAGVQHAHTHQACGYCIQCNTPRHKPLDLGPSFDHDSLQQALHLGTLPHRNSRRGSVPPRLWLPTDRPLCFLLLLLPCHPRCRRHYSCCCCCCCFPRVFLNPTPTGGLRDAGISSGGGSSLAAATAAADTTTELSDAPDRAGGGGSATGSPRSGGLRGLIKEVVTKPKELIKVNGGLSAVLRCCCWLLLPGNRLALPHHHMHTMHTVYTSNCLARWRGEEQPAAMLVRCSPTNTRPPPCGCLLPTLHAGALC